MKQGYLIFNPSAGMRAKTDVRVQEVLRLFAREDIEIIPSPTEAGGSVVQQVKEMVIKSPDLIVAWGGRWNDP